MTLPRLAAALPLCIAAAALGLVGGPGLAAAALGAASLGLAAARPRLAVGLIGEVILGAASLGLGALLGVMTAAPGDEGALPVLWSALAAATLLCAATRQILLLPLGGHRPAWALGLLALICCGATRSGARYGVPVYLFVLASVVQFRLADSHRPALQKVPRRSLVLAAALPIAGALLALLAVAPLRPLQRWVQERFDLAYGDESSRVGFSDRFQLGSLDQLLTSDEIVLRLRGPRAERHGHLRGLVYDHYENGRWTTRGVGRPARVALGQARALAPGDDVLEIRAANDSDRLFLPLGLAALATESGLVVSMGHGVLRRVPPDVGRPLWLQVGERRVLPLLPPTEEDLQVPQGLQAALAALAREWTAGETSPAGRLRRIEGRLGQGYRYALRFQRGPDLDPVMDFLTRHREGHCEYFASAMALLARSVGVPARVAGGYRVAERNPLSGEHIVRERHAHAWVEAHVPGQGWATFDPTPAAALPDAEERDMGTGRALLDLLATRLGAALDELVARPAAVAPAAAGLAAVLSLYLLYRRLRARRGRPQRPGFAAPLPGFLRLEAALGAAGHARDRAEPLERYADRLADPEAAALLRRYAALRYGGEGDAAALDAALADHAQRLTRRG